MLRFFNPLQNLRESSLAQSAMGVARTVIYTDRARPHSIAIIRSHPAHAYQVSFLKIFCGTIMFCRQWSRRDHCNIGLHTWVFQMCKMCTPLFVFSTQACFRVFHPCQQYSKCFLARPVASVKPCILFDIVPSTVCGVTIFVGSPINGARSGFKPSSLIKHIHIECLCGTEYMYLWDHRCCRPLPCICMQFRLRSMHYRKIYRR